MIPKLGLVAVVAALTVTLVGAKKNNPADTEYLELVKKVTAGDLSIDFRSLRLACANAGVCNGRGESADILAMHRAAQAGDHRKAAQIGEKLITAGFPNIELRATEKRKPRRSR